MLTPISKDYEPSCSSHEQCKILSFFSSNVFVCYERWFTSGQKQHLFKCFKPRNGYFHVVALYTFEETYRLLESPFHAELNGSCPNFIY